MRIGYSFWGFLGPGITDTPDGGRSHRRPLIDGLTAAGHDLVFLQRNRDLEEAGHDLRATLRLARRAARDRRAVPGMAVAATWPQHHQMRQPRAHLRPAPSGRARRALHGRAQGSRRSSWDKDLRLEPRSPLRSLPSVAVCEAALEPSPGADSLLFPVADTALDCADPVSLAAMPRPLPLVYAGNQYDRDEAFSMFFAPAAARYTHRVAGKWTRTSDWPHVNFTGRCTFPEVRELHESALATVLLLPDTVRPERDR